MIAGTLIALVLEMAGVASLAFAVGLYLPLATSAPILAGGLLRAWVEQRRHNAGDHDDGVLLASGYIAGGALAGIVIAILAGVLGTFDAAVTAWSASNPAFDGPWSNSLSLLPFALIGFLLLRAGLARR